MLPRLLHEPSTLALEIGQPLLMLLRLKIDLIWFDLIFTTYSSQVLVWTKELFTSDHLFIYFFFIFSHSTWFVMRHLVHDKKFNKFKLNSVGSIQWHPSGRSQCEWSRTYALNGYLLATSLAVKTLIFVDTCNPHPCTYFTTPRSTGRVARDNVNSFGVVPVHLWSSCIIFEEISPVFEAIHLGTAIATFPQRKLRAR